MNYRHAYHAGNFADVLKHTVLALVIEHLKRKEAAFRVIDTHAGAGSYALASSEASKTGEWQGGIGRLLGPGAKPLPQPLAQHLQPYLEAVRAANPAGGLRIYPGSPSIALSLMRPQDTLIANELHPEEASALKAAIGRDRRAKPMALDAWMALKSLLPPTERRGIILIDPPFEEPAELERMTVGIAQGLQRFATGIYVAWYPIKDLRPINQFHAALAALAVPKLLRVELLLMRPSDPERLNGCGLIVANPPYTLKGELAAILPDLSRRFATDDRGAGYRLDWIGTQSADPVEARSSPKRRMHQAIKSKR
jgi:23S rRNA (adenine2030-N6)-methyltransferase